ncbi:hypothetical protein [Aurantimonas marina]|uniref:hypothetical protein n=1 Tax=Aurantimonas marina TaxID=2780508 RepID=UPI001E4E4058|nr:hypothetical protein [Aurantimonas marina]
MFVDARLSAIIGALLLASVPGAAQDIPIPSLLDRSVGGLFNGGEPREPGGYVSPSATELIPDSRDVGAAPQGSLRRFEPIALPSSLGRPSAPAISLPGLPAYAPQNMPSKDVITPRAPLILEARLTKDSETIPNGLIWRLFSAIPALDGRPTLIASSQSSIANFEVPAGSYILHVGFGRAGIIKRIEFSGVRTRETVVLGAGGLKLEAIAADGSAIDPKKLKFDVYTDAEDDSDRDLVASDVPPDKVLRLNADTYHVVSSYGSVNASVRADIRVEPGKITEARLQHRAALLTMKLVREQGGEAIADTAWSITTASGDVVRESVGAFPSMVLAAGDYVIVAKNRDKVYQRQFEVRAGENTDVEVLASEVAAVVDPSVGSGD